MSVPDRINIAAAGVRSRIKGRPGAEDFRRICTEMNVMVPEPGWIPKLDVIAASLPVDGLAFRIEGRFCILVKSLFIGGEFNVRTAFHELGHVLLGHLDEPGVHTLNRFIAETDRFDQESEANELEADRFADLVLSD